MTIEQIIDQIHPISTVAKQKITATISKVHLKKGAIIFDSNKLNKDFYFIKKGIARAYSQKENTEVTFWFGGEGDSIISIKSYVNNQVSYETIEALEDMQLYQLKTADLFNLYEHDIEIANWGRKLAEKELIKVEERLIDWQFKSAKERYLHLIIHHPELIQRVQLGYIASFLGITQVSLSRIRAEMNR